MASMSFYEGLALLQSRTRIAIVSIWTVIASALLVCVGEVLAAIGVIDTYAPEPTALTLAYVFVSLAFTVLFIVSVVLVSMWIYRAHANLFAAGYQDLEFSPSWSVGWFFVPIANLFKPFQAMKELWNVSHGVSNQFGEVSAGSVTTWWGCYIVGNIISMVAFRIETNATSMEAVQTASGIGAIGSLLTVGAGWFLLKVMGEVLEAQRNHVQAAEAFA